MSFQKYIVERLAVVVSCHSGKVIAFGVDSFGRFRPIKTLFDYGLRPFQTSHCMLYTLSINDPCLQYCYANISTNCFKSPIPLNVFGGTVMPSAQPKKIFLYFVFDISIGSLHQLHRYIPDSADVCSSTSLLHCIILPHLSAIGSL